MAERVPQPALVEVLDESGMEAIQRNFEAIFNEDLTDVVLDEVSATLAEQAGGRSYVTTNVDGDLLVQEIPILATDGGTGITVYAVGDILYANSTTTITALTKDANATRYLSNTGASNIPAWAQITLSNGVTGDLPFANIVQISGGTVLGNTSGSTADIAAISTLPTTVQDNITRLGIVLSGSFPAANLSGTTLAGGVTASSLTSVGSSLTTSGQFFGGDGSAGSPTYCFTNDTDIGMFRSNTNRLSLATGGSTRLTVANTGIEVQGSIDTNNGANINGAGIQVDNPTGGNKGSGTINARVDVYKNDSVYSNPDYVFEHFYTGGITKYADREGAKGYEGLKPLTEVESFAKIHWHLPGVPDRKGIFERADIALEKIEEVYLYLFQLERRLSLLETN